MGELNGEIAIKKDIGERKKTEIALRESEERYRTLFDDARDGIALADAETGKIVECNQSLCRMIEKDKSELIGQPQSILHPPRPLVNDLSPTFIKHKSEDSGQILEEQLLSKSGKFIPVEIRAAQVFMNGHGYILGIFRDITERKRLEKEKENLQAQLFQAQKLEAIGTLAGGVAHDFNNLLTAINGYIHFTMAKVEETGPIYRDLKQASIAAGRAAGVVRQLLLFSRKQAMEPRALNLNETVNNLIKMLTRLISENIPIETNLDPSAK
jgi:two-component system, cell cycle sensor histidine kinase and response regulator CckA